MLIVFLVVLYIAIVYLALTEQLILDLTPDKIANLFGSKSLSWIGEIIQNPKRIASFFLVSKLFVSSLAIIIFFNAIFNSGFLVYFSTLIRFLIAFILVFASYLFSAYILPSAIAELVTAKGIVFLMPLGMIFYRLSYPIVLLSERIIKARQYKGIVCHNYIEKPIDVENIDSTLKSDGMDIMRHIFEFGETITREVMIPRIDVVAVPVETSADELVQLIKQTGHSRIPVYRETIDEIVGIVYAKDLLIAMADDPQVSLEKIMREPCFVPEVKPVAKLFNEMKEKRVHFAVVVDEYGGTAGIVTLEDLIEELVGEIEDEYDMKEELFKKIDDKNYIVSGKLLVADVNEELSMDLPEEEADTIGGFLFKLKGGIPSQGEKLVWGKYTFEVLEIRKNRVMKVKIKKNE